MRAVSLLLLLLLMLLAKASLLGKHLRCLVQPARLQVFLPSTHCSERKPTRHKWVTDRLGTDHIQQLDPPV